MWLNDVSAHNHTNNRKHTQALAESQPSHAKRQENGWLPGTVHMFGSHASIHARAALAEIPTLLPVEGVAA